MKKLAIILALLIMPCAAFGLEMLNDSALDNVTGQSGVSIAVDDVQLFINIEKLAWIDCDGINSSAGSCTGDPSDPGAIGLNNFQIDVLNVNAIVDGTSTTAAGGATVWQLDSTACGQINLFYNYANTASAGCYLGSGTATQTLGLNNYTGIGTGGDFKARALTIDATDKLPALTEGFQANTGSSLDVGGVLIGIPTLEVYIQSMSLTPIYDGDISGSPSNASNDNDHGADFGTIEMQGITFTTLSGWIEIAPH